MKKLWRHYRLLPLGASSARTFASSPRDNEGESCSSGATVVFTASVNTQASDFLKRAYISKRLHFFLLFFLLLFPVHFNNNNNDSSSSKLAAAPHSCEMHRLPSERGETLK